jgi:hypothetical protein
VLFLSLIFCKQEEQLLFFGSVSGCNCLTLHGYSIFCFVHDAQDQVQDCVISHIVEDFEVPLYLFILLPLTLRTLRERIAYSCNTIMSLHALGISVDFHIELFDNTLLKESCLQVLSVFFNFI